MYLPTSAHWARLSTVMQIIRTLYLRVEAVVGSHCKPTVQVVEFFVHLNNYQYTIQQNNFDIIFLQTLFMLVVSAFPRIPPIST